MGQNVDARGGIWVRYRKKYRVTTSSQYSHPVFPNRLERSCRIERPNQAWAGDLSDIWTHERWLCLAVVMDLYSRKIVGWSMSHGINARFVCDALKYAIWNRRREKGLIFLFRPRGFKASHAFQRLLKANGILGSMSRKGDC